MNMSWAKSTENERRVICHTNGYEWLSVSSNVGWESGTYNWRVQMVKRGSGFPLEQIGVITDYEGTNMAKKTLHNLGNSVYYYAYDHWIYKDKQRMKNAYDTWKSGDVMQLFIDCENWTIKFCLNHRNLGTIKLTPNRKYYPAISFMAKQGYDFKLLP